MQKKIVIVDDSEVNLLLINSIFEGEKSIQLFLESDSRNAVRLIRKERPDVVLLDLMMPKIDGFQILKEIKSDPDLTHVPVLVVTARQDQATYDEVMKYQVVDYIKKPIDLDDLESKIRNILKEQTMA
ncbi:MAG: response regulator [Bacteroidota bacterium]